MVYTAAVYCSQRLCATLNILIYLVIGLFTVPMDTFSTHHSENITSHTRNNKNF
uniref:Uncharacterized protein n=1 Tax=Anguilla anguilla TaxID=7936 RepID=A0A0E9VX41_ANGAN